MELATINDAAEQKAMKTFLDSSGVGVNEEFWVGGNSLDCSTGWYWSNGKPMKYTNWRSATHEPNNAGGNEKCLLLNQKANNNNYEWNDCYCNHSFYFICEEKC